MQYINKYTQTFNGLRFHSSHKKIINKTLKKTCSGWQIFIFSLATLDPDKVSTVKYLSRDIYNHWSFMFMTSCSSIINVIRGCARQRSLMWFVVQNDNNFTWFSLISEYLLSANWFDYISRGFWILLSSNLITVLNPQLH